LEAPAPPVEGARAPLGGLRVGDDGARGPAVLEGERGLGARGRALLGEGGGRDDGGPVAQVVGGTGLDVAGGVGEPVWRRSLLRAALLGGALEGPGVRVRLAERMPRVHEALYDGGMVGEEVRVALETCCDAVRLSEETGDVLLQVRRDDELGTSVLHE